SSVCTIEELARSEVVALNEQALSEEFFSASRLAARGTFDRLHERIDRLGFFVAAERARHRACFSRELKGGLSIAPAPCELCRQAQRGDLRGVEVFLAVWPTPLDEIDGAHCDVTCAIDVLRTGVGLRDEKQELDLLFAEDALRLADEPADVEDV